MGSNGGVFRRGACAVAASYSDRCSTARLIGATRRRRLTHVLIGTPMDTRMKSSCSRSSNARGILGSRSSQLDDTNANRDANRHHWSCDIDPQEPQMMK
jgi:hypothetical protein